MDRTKGEKTKENIIKASSELFLLNGYNATGISDILKATHLPKGSFYYHFKSKSELGVAVCNYFEEQYEKFFIKSAKGMNSWEEFITSLISQIETAIKQERFYGCPFAILGTELTKVEPEIAKCCVKAFDRLKHFFLNMLKKMGVDEEEAKELANKCFAIYEGYLVYYRISFDKEVLASMKEALIDLYNKR